MKKLNFLFAGMFFLVLSFNLKAQAPLDYFVGKWNVEVQGTPQGDGKMIVILERKDGKLTGNLNAKEMTEPTKFTKVDETEKSVTVYFTSQGYEVYLKLEKMDDNHVTGNMMDMFDATGERIKDTATKKSEMN